MGKGRMDGFRWQINERGVANIVESSRDYVEGLVYQIGAEDRKQLNRSEGVSRGFYSDESLLVQFTPLPNGGVKSFHVARDLEDIDERDVPGKGENQIIVDSRLGRPPRTAMIDL